MPRTLKSDPVLFYATVALVGVSVVMVWSASAVVAMERLQQPYFFLTKQLMWSFMGLAVMWGAMNIDYRLYRDAKIGQIYEGTSNLQLQTIAKNLLS